MVGGLPPTDTFYIEFDTLDMPGKLVAVKVILTKEIIDGAKDAKRGLRIDLADHPLYSNLVEYCKANPVRRRV